MDFTHQRRARINGVAVISEPDSAIKVMWPDAQAVVIVTVEQAYGNCTARIPKMHMVEGSDR